MLIVNILSLFILLFSHSATSYEVHKVNETRVLRRFSRQSFSSNHPPIVESFISTDSENPQIESVKQENTSEDKATPIAQNEAEIQIPVAVIYDEEIKIPERNHPPLNKGNQKDRIPQKRRTPISGSVSEPEKAPSAEIVPNPKRRKVVTVRKRTEILGNIGNKQMDRTNVKNETSSTDKDIQTEIENKVLKGKIKDIELKPTEETLEPVSQLPVQKIVDDKSKIEDENSDLQYNKSGKKYFQKLTRPVVSSEETKKNSADENYNVNVKADIPAKPTNNRQIPSRGKQTTTKVEKEVPQEQESNKKTRQRDPVVRIIDNQNFVYANTGTFHYSYEGGDGTKAFEKGELKTIDGEMKGEAVVGSYSYKDKDGNDFSLSYTADENGYRPVGAHLPTPPPIPPEIARALKYLATKTTPIEEAVTESIKKH